MRFFGYTIALVCLAGCGCGDPPQPINRSWQGGKISVEPFRDGQSLGVRVSGEWPKASEDLWIRYHLWLTQENSNDVCMLIGSKRLSEFIDGVGDYSGGSLRKIDRSRPYRAVLDYEIWEGQPDEGKLAKKDSVFSHPIIATAGGVGQENGLAQNSATMRNRLDNAAK